MFSAAAAGVVVLQMRRFPYNPGCCGLGGHPLTAPGFFKRTLTKPDGRLLLLYGRQPIMDGLVATQPLGDAPAPANPHLRWHPLRGEWVAYAGHRQNRTFLPPPEFNPLAPTQHANNPTELPAGNYDVAVFENRFPALVAGAHDPPAGVVDTRPAQGACEVVVFTRDPSSSLGKLPLDHLELVLEVWADRTAELGARDDVKYVFPFENRGVEVGVTLQHPHGQIYAYPFVPPIPALELELQKQHLQSTGRGLLHDVINNELRDSRRLLYRGAEAVAFMPAFARYGYEVWVAPLQAVPSLTLLSAAQRRDLARALKTVLLKFDGLWQRPFPYIMAIHQAPSDGEEHLEAHVHFEFYPAFRMQNRLKYLAGSEMGAGVFMADSVPEDKVKELQAVEVRLE